MHISQQGVDADKFDRDKAKECLVRTRHHLGEKRVLLTLARLVERKGHDTVIKAMPSILEVLPNTVYLVAGVGLMESKLKELALAYGVEDNVVFCGFVPDEEVPAYYHICDVFVMPNREVDGGRRGLRYLLRGGGHLRQGSRWRTICGCRGGH